jgi:hypothetical protein
MSWQEVATDSCQMTLYMIFEVEKQCCVNEHLVGTQCEVNKISFINQTYNLLRWIGHINIEILKS